MKTQLELAENESCTTHFYLPLNKKDLNTKDLVTKCIDKFNSNLLLFCQKLKKINILDEVNSSSLSIVKSIKDEQNVSLETTRFDQTRDIANYKLYEKQVHIPNDIAKEEKISNSSLNTKITLVFPIEDNNARRTYPVCAFLPVSSCDLEFKFIINAYWLLTTNRESINEHSSLNNLLLSEVSDLFVKVVINDETLKKNLKSYLPKSNMKMSTWWLTFIETIKIKLRDHYKEDQAVVTRIFNPQMEKLVNNTSDLTLFKEIALYRIFDVNECLADYLDYKIFTIHDLIDIIAHINCNNKKLIEWKDTRSKEWWQLFFESINSIAKKDLNLTEKLHSLDIYQIWSPQEESINSTRTSISSCEDLKIMNNKNSSFKQSSLWRSNIKLVAYESESEFKYLKDTLDLKEFDEVRDTIDLIKSNHQHNKCHDPILIWNELKFVKENFEQFKSQVKTNIVDGELLNLPVRTGQNSVQFVSAKFACIPSFLNVNLTSMLLDGVCLFIDFDEYSKDLNHLEVLGWEYFFLQIGCKLPDLNMELFTHDKLVFYDFSVYSSNDCVQLAIQIFDYIKDTDSVLVEKLKRLPIKATFKDMNDFYVPINKVCGKANNLRPYVVLNSKEALDLASRFNIDLHAPAESQLICDEDDDDESVKPKNSAPIVSSTLNSADDDESTRGLVFECFDFNKKILNFVDFPTSNDSIIYKENDDKRVEIGRKAEYYFYQFLSNYYANDKFKWVTKIANFFIGGAPGNDTLGYDFTLEDRQRNGQPLFENYSNSIRYVIEVKGIGYAWSDKIKFHLTENEKATKNKYRNNINYLIVLVENVLNPSKTKIASVINWTKSDVINLDPITYSASIKPSNSWRNINNR